MIGLGIPWWLPRLRFGPLPQPPPEPSTGHSDLSRREAIDNLDRYDKALVDLDQERTRLRYILKIQDQVIAGWVKTMMDGRYILEELERARAKWDWEEKQDG